MAGELLSLVNCLFWISLMLPALVLLQFGFCILLLALSAFDYATSNTRCMQLLNYVISQLSRSDWFRLFTMPFTRRSCFAKFVSCLLRSCLHFLLVWSLRRPINCLECFAL